MSEASELVDRIRTELTPLDERISQHAYLHALEKGQVARETLKGFAGQQYHIITSDLRSIALVVSRHGLLPSRQFLMKVLEGESAALQALETFARALDMSQQALEASEPLPAAHAYCAFMAWLCMYGSDAELAGALLVNFPAWGRNCGRMRDALKKSYRFAASELAFFDLFANLPPFEEEAVAVIQGGLDRGVSPLHVHRAARLLQGYELMYWDAMADAAGVGKG